MTTEQGRVLPPTFERGVVTNVHQGDCHVSGAKDVTFSTVLGSCISACVRDTTTGVGGMNHFLLAHQAESAKDQFGASARYGAFAMEQLINSVLSRGSGRKSDLEIKVFGGGAIANNMQDIGAKNVEFVKSFLADEGYAISSEDMGGPWARRVMYKPHTGQAFVKRLDSGLDEGLAAREIALADQQSQAAEPQNEDIELF